MRVGRGTLAFAVFAVAVSLGCIRLGFWQLDRFHGRKDANTAIAAAEAMPPRPLTTLTDTTADPSSLRFRPTVAAGTYDPAHEVLLYGRSSAEGPL